MTSTSVLPRELEAALDGLIERFGQPADAVGAARALFAERTGRVFEEDEIYEARTVAFLEWFVLEHGEPPPVIQALAQESDAEQAAALRAWASAHHSLFAIESLDEGRVVLVDLWGGAHFEVDERRRLHGVAPGDVIEARLVGWRGRVRFGRTFGFHPAAARAAIAGHLGRIRRAGGTRADGIDFIATLQVKALRWKHVEIAKVYGADR
jgi:hypothetical protein